MFEPLAGHVEEESRSDCDFKLVEWEAHLELGTSESSAGLEDKQVCICIFGTHREQGANTFWNVAGTFFLSSNSVLSWKFCILLHKLLHDGHPNVPRDSSLPVARLGELGHVWNHRHDRCGWLVAIFIMSIIKKVYFHIGWPVFTSGLAVKDGELGTAGESGIGAVFWLIMELFACMDGEINCFEAGSASLDLPRALSVTQAGHCHLAPLTQVIPDPSLRVSRPMEVLL